LTLKFIGTPNVDLTAPDTKPKVSPNIDNLKGIDNAMPNPTISPPINPIDNYMPKNSSSIKFYRVFTFVNIANAALLKDPCEELKRDRDAAKKAKDDKNLSEGERAKVKISEKNINKAIEDCCSSTIGGGGGNNGGFGGLLPNPEIPNITTTTINSITPYPQPTIQNYYICDFRSKNYNNMYQCTISQNIPEKDDIICDESDNKEEVIQEIVTKKIL